MRSVSIASLCIALVRGYRRYLSPVLPRSCRFTPSCSAYAVEALEKHGAWRGAGLSLYRIVRCGPWTAGGYDPVPKTPEERASLNWSDHARAGLRRLRRGLRPEARLAELPPEAREAYHQILHELARHGRRPVWGHRPDAALATLARAGLIALNAADEPVAVGALTLEATDHAVSRRDGSSGAARFYAENALSALSVSPRFGYPTRVESRCAQTGERLVLDQDGAETTIRQGPAHPVVAIRWELDAVMEMAFIRDLAQADAWARGGDRDDVTIYRLDEAVALSAAWFEAPTVEGV